MKVESTQEVEFKPIELKITLETVREAEMFYDIFNYSPLAAVIDGVIDHEAIRESLLEYANGYKYMDFVKRLDDYIAKKK